jgi:hypothetical protein
MDNLRVRTGEPPDIRVGANSEDKTNFDPGTQVGLHDDTLFLSFDIAHSFPRPSFQTGLPQRPIQRRRRLPLVMDITPFLLMCYLGHT